MTTKAELAMAYLAGMTAKQCGRPIEANQYAHRPGRDGELLRERWADGWHDQDATNRGGAA